MGTMTWRLHEGLTLSATLKDWFVLTELHMETEPFTLHSQSVAVLPLERRLCVGFFKLVDQHIDEIILSLKACHIITDFNC